LKFLDIHIHTIKTYGKTNKLHTNTIKIHCNAIKIPLLLLRHHWHILTCNKIPIIMYKYHEKIQMNYINIQLKCPKQAHILNFSFKATPKAP
jgi:hypothetical protein